ncbi:unnamed protein product [Lupinus luteus]|uniref:Uncharacterized protein n=1 Tax=Lupinus luteus TaxID=3873 RepID=A0AAV1WVD2_LUPLU
MRMDLLGFNSLLVTPNSQRVTEVMQTLLYRNRFSYDEKTRACKKLVDFRGKSNELSSRVLDCLRISKASCCLNSDKTLSNSFVDIQKRKNAENISNSSCLKWMKDVVLAKCNDHSFRVVVVGDPDLELS